MLLARLPRLLSVGALGRGSRCALCGLRLRPDDRTSAALFHCFRAPGTYLSTLSLRRCPLPAARCSFSPLAFGTPQVLGAGSDRKLVAKEMETEVRRMLVALNRGTALPTATAATE